MARKGQADRRPRRSCLGEGCPYRIELRRLKWAAAAATASADRRPHYDTKTGKLYVGKVYIRRFKVGTKEDMVLAEFERLRWPPSVVAPRECEPSLVENRLRDVVYSMNDGHLCPLIHFFCDGTGEGACWELVCPVVGGDVPPEQGSSG